MQKALTLGATKEMAVDITEMAIFAQVVDSAAFRRRPGIWTSPPLRGERHVARLEAHLGGRLLLRTTRALSLTELGQQVHAACTRMQTARSCGRQLQRAANGVIRVQRADRVDQTWLAPRLPAFSTCIQVDVRLTLIDRTVDLAENGVDLAIRIA
jgi:DNA-binding transcriptional LysR family regulator